VSSSQFKKKIESVSEMACPKNYSTIGVEWSYILM